MKNTQEGGWLQSLKDLKYTEAININKMDGP